MIGMTNQELMAIWMKHSKFTNQQAADNLGLDISSIKRLKNGALRLTRERKLAMAAILHNIPPYGDPIA